MRAKTLLLGISLALPVWGCGDKVERLEPVALDQLPPGALEAATKKVPGFRAERARKSKLDGQDTIEIIGKTKGGKVVEIEVSRDGRVLEIE